MGEPDHCLKHCAGTGIPIRLGDGVVHDQHHLLVARMLTGTKHTVSGMIMATIKDMSPTLSKYLLIPHLECLDSGTRARAVGHPLMMRHHSSRAIERLEPVFAESKGEIRVFVVGGGIARIEAT